MNPREQANALYREVLLSCRGEEEQTAALRDLSRKDLFYLLTRTLRRADADNDWCFARCREVQAAPDGYIDLWAREHYKLQRLDEPTPTPAGWKLHGDLRPGDEIFGPDGKPCRVVALNSIVTDADCYEIEFDDGTTIQAGAEHLWPIERRTRRRVPRSREKRLYRETVLMQTREIAEHKHAPDRRLALRVNDPLELPTADLAVDPYVLGVWLGDGASSCGTVTSADPEVFREIEHRGFRVGHDIAPSTPVAETRTVYGLSAALRKLGVLGRKHIPAPYLRASIAQRLDLLRGLMDTDGHCNTRGTATFANTNAQLADGVYELATTLGLRPTKRRRIGRDKGAPYPFWQVSFQAYADFCPFLLWRKAARCKRGKRLARHFIVGCRKVPPVPMRCIQVDRPDGLYLTGRTMLPTHNSTIITFALTIQDILNDPELTFGIFSHTRPIAKGFLRQIKQEFEANQALKELFSDVLWADPARQAPKWSEDDGIVVRRQGNPKESTVEAWGIVDGQPIGKHFRRIVYDDIVTKDTVQTPEMIRKTTEAWELSVSLGTIDGRRRIAGTRYHYNDTYATIIERKAAIPRIYPATVDGRDGSPSVFIPQWKLDEIRRDQGPYRFAAQYLLNPKESGTESFKEEWLRYWKADDWRGMNLYILVDPAHSRKRTSDYTTMAVVGFGADGNRYVVDMVRERLSLTQRADRLFVLHRKYRPLKVGYEEYGLQADIEYVRDRQERENYRFEIRALGGSMRKEDRIAGLIPWFEQGRIYLPHKIVARDDRGELINLVEAFVNQEYLSWPFTVHDDMLDALARMTDETLGAREPGGSGKRNTGKFPVAGRANSSYNALRH